MAKNTLVDEFSEPLNGVASARIDIYAGDGNLTIDRLTGSDPALASGTLQYIGNQNMPTRSLDLSNGQATLTLRGNEAGKPWFRLPWSACNGATEWQIHLNPKIPSEITAHSGGGNVRLDLSSMDVTSVSAETGGGNVEVILPDGAMDLNVTARTGAGNVSVSLPSGIAARIQATTGLGKVIVDPTFGETGNNTYQSPDFDLATNKIEIVASSGAGNVIVDTW
jgi:hypothetical protein